MSAMPRPRVLLVALLAAAALLVGTRPAPAQFASENVDLLAQVPLSAFPSNPANGNDCWGYVSPSGREYALMGLSDALAVVEITDPTNPVIIGSVGHSASLWADVKVYGEYCYVSNEEGGGLDVIDLSGVDQGQVSLVRRVTTSGLRTAHNVVIDEESGYLYLCGPNINGGDLVAFDLSDPSNPVLAGTWNGAYSHDAQVVTYADGPFAGREIAFACSENRGLDVVDVTDKSNMFLVARRSYANVRYCHQGWLSEDRRYFYVNDELDELDGVVTTTRTIVFDVSDIENPVVVGEFTSGERSSDHNLYVHEGIIYEANYTSGLRIFDANDDPTAPFEVGYFDTYPGSNGPGFEGAWSVYPFFPSGTVIVSDINRGLFVLDVSDAIRGLSFDFPGGRPDRVEPSGGTTMQVDVAGRGTDLVGGSGILHVDVGSGFTEIPMTDLGGGSFLATFPPSTCGEDVEWYVSADSSDAGIFTSPGNAPAEVYEAVSAGVVETIFADDFETDRGWTTTNSGVDTGAWVRAVPSGGGQRGDPSADADGSGRCFVTGNGNDEDLDGGPTRLLSPVIDLAGFDDLVRLEVALWHTNDDGDDVLDVEFSDDGGQTWTRAARIAGTVGWETRVWRVADFVAITDAFRARFVASDNPNDSVTESGVDAFDLFTPAGCGTGLVLEVDPLVAGETGRLRTTNATTGEPVYFIYSRSGEGSTPVPGLGVTLGLDRPTLAGTVTPDAGGFAEFAATIPGGLRDTLIWLQIAQTGRLSDVVLEQIN